MKKLFALLFPVLATISLHANYLPEKKAASSYNNLRGSGMNFIENKGQMVDANNNLRPDILFKGDGNGTDVYIRKTGISYVMSNMGEVMNDLKLQTEEFGKQGMSEEEIVLKERDLMKGAEIKTQRIDLNFVNANSSSIIESYDEVEGYNNYYYPHCPGGIIGVKGFNRIVQKEIWPNIDIVYYGGKEQGLKYDIVVRPGGNPDDIRLKYLGAEGLEILNNELIIKNSFKEIIETLPRVYQNINGKIIDVKTKYQLEGETLNFKLSNFQTSYPLTIDPWITYYGGSQVEGANQIAVDKNGDAVISGNSQSINFPVSLGAFQTSYSGGSMMDAVIVKFTANGNRLWATYYGPVFLALGSVSHNVIALDGAGSVFITGHTNSSSLPITPGAFQTTINGIEIFLAKFNSSGSMLWATFMGGSSADEAYGISSDLQGNVIITGSTMSADFPVSPAAFSVNATFITNLFGEVFIAKFNGSGARLWSTYMKAQSGIDDSCPVTTDSNSSIIFSFGGIIAKFNPNGGLIWNNSYYLARDIAIDNQDNIVLCGMVGVGFPATSAAFQTAPGGGGQDCFLAKMSATGTVLWATYFGGNASENSPYCSIDSRNNIYMIAEWEDGSPSSSFSASSCAYQKSFGGAEDEFIVKFDPAGNYICSTYLGGNSEDEMENSASGGIVCFGNDIYFTLSSSFGGYPTTSGAYQGTNGGSWDMVVGKLCGIGCGAAPLPSLAFTSSSSAICSGSSINFTDQSSIPSCDPSAFKWEWSFSGGTPSVSTNQNPSGIVYNLPGTYSVKLVITSCEKDSLVKNAYLTVNPCGCSNPPIPLVNLTNATCNNTNGAGSVSVNSGTGTAPYTYSWSNGHTGSTAVGLASGTYTVVVNDAAGCQYTTLSTISNSTPSLTPNIVQHVSCYGGSNGSIDMVTAGGKSPYTYLWSSASGGGQTTEDISGLLPGTYSLTFADANNCTSSLTVIISQPQQPVISKQFPNCITGAGNNGQASVSLTSGSVPPLSYAWNTIPVQTTVTATGLSPGSYTVNVLDGLGCVSATQVDLTTDFLSVTPNSSICSGTNVQLSAVKNNSTYSTNFSCGSVLLPCSGSGTTIRAGTGTTATSALQAWLSPFDGSKTGQRIQFLYPAANLIASGISAGVISEIAFYVSTKNSTQPFNGFTIKMSCSDNWVSNTSPIVYGPVNYSTTTGWNNFILSNSYHWDGISPLYVEICWSNSSATAADLVYRDAIGSTPNASGASINANCSFTGTWGSSSSGVDIQITSCPVTVPTITWSPASGLSNATISNPVASPAATTTYTVTSYGVNGCTLQGIVTVSIIPCGFNAFANGGSVCAGGCAAVSASAISGTAPYTYIWSNGATGQNINVCPTSSTTYTVTVTDNTGTSTTATTTVAISSALNNSPAITHVSCNGGSNGVAVASPSGGSTPYSYSWTGGSTQSTISNLSQGNYSVTITDALGCITNTVVSITEPLALSLTTNTATANCNQGSGSATINPSGGTGPYSYLWSNSSTTQQISNLSSATYSVIVTDNKGCTGASAITVGNMPGVTAQLATSASASCYSNCNGTASVSGSGGTNPYTFLWSNGSTKASASNLCAAAYTATVTDAAGCFSTTNVIITEPSPISILSSQVNVNCNGGNDGVAGVSVAGGTGTYTYSWSPISGNQSSVTNLIVGNYTITITDVSGCNTDTVITITEPPILSYSIAMTDASCGSSNGTATIHVSGGTPGYYYYWGTGSNDSTIINQPSNTYTVIASDNNGCSIQTTATINNVGIPTSIINQPNLCMGSTYTLPDGSITNTSGIYTHTLNTIAGCDSAITTQLNIGSPIIIIQNPGICSGSTYTLPLGAVVNTSGTYKDTLTAIGGCDSIITINLSVFSTSNLTQNPSICSGNSYTLPNGSITSTSGIYTHSFTTTNGCDSIITTNLIVNNLAIGNQVLAPTCDSLQYNNQWYYATQVISDTIPNGSAQGCDSITTTQMPINSSANNIISPIACNSYTSNSQTYTATGIYTQMLSTSKGCDSLLTINLIISNSISTADTQTICSGQAVIIHGLSRDTTGIYTQTFFATGGCDSISTITLSVQNSPVANAGNDTTVQAGQGITLTALGSVASAYSWSTGETTTSISMQPTITTTYILTATDNNGCTSRDTVTIFVENPCDNNAEVFVPNSFSPNEDGQNDVLKLYSIGVPETIYFAIYNRWGEKVFETDNTSTSWDGIYRNKKMDTAVFTYLLKITCKKAAAEAIKTGNISLLR